MGRSPPSSRSSSSGNSTPRSFDNTTVSPNEGLGLRPKSPPGTPSHNRLEGSRSQPSGLQIRKKSPTNDPSLHRLAGTTTHEKGGLEIRKHTADNSRRSPSRSSSSSERNSRETSTRPSLLGLDRLAAEKRKASEEERERKSVKVEEDEEKEGRKYRNYRVDTPSSTPGITDEVRERLADRRKERDRGFQVSSLSKDHDKRRENWKRERVREGDDDRSSRSSRHDSSKRDALTPRIHPKGKV